MSLPALRCVILNPSLCHSEPFACHSEAIAEESPLFAQDKLREEAFAAGSRSYRLTLFLSIRGRKISQSLLSFEMTGAEEGVYQGRHPAA